MGSGFSKSKLGFTLMELMVVLVIIAILLAIAIPMFINNVRSAEQAVLKYNGTHIVKVIALNFYSFDLEDRYDTPTASYSEDSLNNFLFQELEDHQVNSNRDTIVNPKSRSKKLLHGNNPVSGSIDDGRNPAVFITGNAAYSYEGSGPLENLIGTIVVYFNQSSPYTVQVYYINRDSEKAESTLLDLD